MRILPAENLRIPEEGSSAQGKSGPKARPKGVVDGQQVEIPVPPSIVVSFGDKSEVVTQKGRSSSGWMGVQASREQGRQIRLARILRRDGEAK